MNATVTSIEALDPVEELSYEASAKAPKEKELPSMLEEVDVLKFENYQLKISNLETAYSKLKEEFQAHQQAMMDKYKIGQADKLDLTTRIITRS